MVKARQFKVNFTYRFGNNQVKASRNRKTGTDDESKRVGGGGGGGYNNKLFHIVAARAPQMQGVDHRKF